MTPRRLRKRYFVPLLLLVCTFDPDALLASAFCVRSALTTSAARQRSSSVALLTAGLLSRRGSRTEIKKAVRRVIWSARALSSRTLQPLRDVRSSPEETPSDRGVWRPPNATWATSVEELRERHGERESWWGDLDARATRALYHECMPYDLLEDSRPVDERARLAVAARRAARLYARERTIIPLALASQLADGLRQLHEQGRFQAEGPSEEQIWVKYAQRCGLPRKTVVRQLARSAGHRPSGGGEAARLSAEEMALLCDLVLRKSCTTNADVDLLVGL